MQHIHDWIYQQKEKEKEFSIKTENIILKIISSRTSKYSQAPQTKYIPRKICLSLEFIKSPPSFVYIYVGFTPHNNIKC